MHLFKLAFSTPAALQVRPWIQELSVAQYSDPAAQVSHLTPREAFRAGVAQGLLQASLERDVALETERAQSRQVQVHAEALEFNRFLQLFRAQLNSVEQSFASQLIDLAGLIAQAVVAEHVETHPEAILPIVQETIDHLGPSTELMTVFVHPLNHAQVSTWFEATLEPEQFRVCADAGLQRGDCRVTCGPTQIDQRLATRFREALHQVGRPTVQPAHPEQAHP